MIDSRLLEQWFALASSVRQATQDMEADDQGTDVLPTAAELARQHKMDLERAKKALKVLKDAGVLQTIGIHPKRYRYDTYRLRHELNPEDLPDETLSACVRHLQEGTTPEPAEMESRQPRKRR